MRETDIVALRQVLLADDMRFTALVARARLDPARDFVAGNLTGIIVSPDEDLAGFDFSFASLAGAQLCGVDLREVRFEETNLSGADLRGAKYTSDQLQSANLKNTRVGAWKENANTPPRPISVDPVDLAVREALRAAAGDVEQLVVISYQHWLNGEPEISEAIGAAAEQWALEEAGESSLVHLRAQRYRLLAISSLGRPADARAGLRDILESALRHGEIELCFEIRCDLGSLDIEAEAVGTKHELERLVEDATKAFGKQNMFTIRAEHLLGRAILARGDLSEGSALLLALIPAAITAVGEDHAETLGIRCSLGLALLMLDQPVEADSQAMRIEEFSPPTGDWLPQYAASLEKLRAFLDKEMTRGTSPPSPASPPSIAIIGSGPAGFYTAEACQKIFGPQVRIDIFDRLPVPYGLIRAGVAPDHQSIKGVTRRHEATALQPNTRFIGNVTVGADISIGELREFYDAVVVATGAPQDRSLKIPGEELPGVYGSAAIAGWYNGHPDFGILAPPLDGPLVIVGNGNVAVDVARIFAKTEREFEGSDIVSYALDHLRQSKLEQIIILSRRGPAQSSITPKELAELAHLERAAPFVASSDLPATTVDDGMDSAARKSLQHFRNFAEHAPEKPLVIAFDFFARPIAIEGVERVERVIVERTTLDSAGNVQASGETYAIPAGLVVTCIGYRTPPLEGVPYDGALGRFISEQGRVGPGLYCVGWARRGPTGTIGTNRPDGVAIAERIADDMKGARGRKPGGAAFDKLAKARDLQVVTFSDWQKIDAAEIERARSGATREKITQRSELLDHRFAG